ncbi:glycosyltransferase [Terrisporobacter petrolearius]|uniref:glycosyltransferase n=1 Tax=Terrisporobacter petrolearius TaxID=1460447 RepID=UPI0022E2E7EF|nr:glycosyltransferase [Terrisporobacter petrolearius]
MKVCFCSTFLNDEKDAILNSKIAPSVSTHNFNINLLNGLRKNLGNDLTIINTEKLASFPNYRKVLIKSTREMNDKIGMYFNIGKINLPILKDIIEYFKLKRQLEKWIKFNTNDAMYICAYGRRLSHVLAINKMKKIYPEITTCMALADLSGNLACKTASYGRVKDQIANMLLDFQIKQSKKFDSFVLLTKQMYEYLKLNNKPFTIIEGIYSTDLINSDININENTSEKKIIAYSGILSSQYNVDNLLDVFELIQDSNYQLWLFGDGDLKSKIVEKSKSDNRIKFFGYVDNKSLKEHLNKATVLINPRQNIGEYTKYSFPSKVIEYLTLKKPVIGYKLDGIPDEYDKYIFYPNDNTVESLRYEIEKVCNYNSGQLHEIGNVNYNFICEYKNSTVQTNKILNMFKNMEGEKL